MDPSLGEGGQFALSISDPKCILNNNYRLNQLGKGKYVQNCLSTEPGHIDNYRFNICQQDDDMDNNCEQDISNRNIARQTIVSRIIIFPLSWDRLPSWGNIRGYFKRGGNLRNISNR